MPATPSSTLIRVTPLVPSSQTLLSPSNSTPSNPTQGPPNLSNPTPLNPSNPAPLDPFEPDPVDGGVHIDLFVTLDLEMVNTVVLPTRTVESYGRLLVYSIVSFHLGLYVGLVLYPSLSKALRNSFK